MACHTDQEKKMKFWKSWFFQSKIGHANFAHNSILELSNELLLVSCSVLLDAHAIFGLIWYTMGLGTSQICIFRSLMLPSSGSKGYRILLNQGKIGHFLPNFCYSYHVSTYIFECVGLFFENFWKIQILAQCYKNCKNCPILKFYIPILSKIFHYHEYNNAKMIETQ